MINITPVILCGGSGTRLWPLSRQFYPKQFIELFGNKTLFQESILRAISIQSKEIVIDQIIVITNESHRFLVLDQLDDLKIDVKVKIILEPYPKNTAPALTLAAFASYEDNPESILVVTPADHYVRNINNFVNSIHNAVASTKNETIFLLGAIPTRPETGYGYIEYSNSEKIKDVSLFCEKPNQQLASEMIEQGNYAWNAGIFILNSFVWIKSIKKCSENIYSNVFLSWKKKTKDEWFVRPGEDNFKLIDSNSIDYAVIENAKKININLKLVLLESDWNDLGTFASLYDLNEKDKDGNVIHGDVAFVNSSNNFLFSTKRSLALLDVNNIIVVETDDCIFISDKNTKSSVSSLLNIIKFKNPDLLNERSRIYRPWGWFETIESSSNYKVKKIQINSGKSISLQRHKKRSEHWVVVVGRAKITKGNNVFYLNENESTFIEKNQIHRLENETNKILQIIEVQSGTYLGEDDIERIEDKYGR